MVSKKIINTTDSRTAFVLASKGQTAPILTGGNDWPGVLRAAKDLGTDFERVTGTVAEVLHRSANDCAKIPVAIIAGTVGKCELIDLMVAEKKIDSGFLSLHTEAFTITAIKNPIPGVGSALVIAGSDKRGTIFGLYEISAQIGVSPWYWWADVPPKKSTELFADPSCHISEFPGVRYRGIFLNDEYPALTKWVHSTYGSAPPSPGRPTRDDVANYGREFYFRIFELLLRLKANYLWPAMWNNAFNEDDPENARLADEWGIVMGNSHQEPMLRAQKEWDRRYKKDLGYWNYSKHADILEKFWREGIERNKDYESIVTIGLRGADDTEMGPGGVAANRARLEKIINIQREIIAKATGKGAEKTPQLWSIYKEIQEYYNDGMRVNDDVTLLWSDDNWGNLRRLPTEEERKRSGGAGIYYHFDYHGGPRNYQWTNTMQISKIWDQMTLARQYGADRIWIVNVGHFKGYEYPVSFFMDLAWSPEKHTAESINDYTREWASGIFGEKLSAEAASIIEDCARFNARRKPELLATTTFSPVNYREAERVDAEWRALEARAKALYAEAPVEMRDTVYQLVLFPVIGSALITEIYTTAEKNRLWSAQGRIAANAEAKKVHELFAEFKALVDEYHTKISSGKWNHFMDQTVLGYLSWFDPSENTIDHLKLTQVVSLERPFMGISIEGSAGSWPSNAVIPDDINYPALPPFDSLNKQNRWIEIFNRGKGSVDYKLVPSAKWILLDKPALRVKSQERIEVSIDWAQIPYGNSRGIIKVNANGIDVGIVIQALKIAEAELGNVEAFVETDYTLAIDSIHFSKNKNAPNSSWVPVTGFGKRKSGMRSICENIDIGSAALVSSELPCLEYPAFFMHGGEGTIILDISPALNFLEGEDIRVGFSIDDESVESITAVSADYAVTNENTDWGLCVTDNGRKIKTKRTIAKAGAHTLKVWMLSPGVVLERITVDMGGLRPSYLGPGESYYHTR